MNRIDVSSISFDDLKANLKAYLSSKPEFQDWNFEGSNISYLMDMLTFAEYTTNTYNAFSLNESFLNTANLRSSIVAHGIPHGYTPKSSSAAEMTIKFGLDIAAITAAGLALPDYTVLQKYALFTVKIGDTSYIFSPDKNNAIYYDAGTFLSDTITLREGVKTTLSAVYSTQNVFELPDKADTNTLEVTVDGEVWTYAGSEINLLADAKVYYVRENSRGKFEVYFGTGVTSAAPADISIVNIDVLVTNEDSANAGVSPIDIVYAETLSINGIDYTDYITITVISKPSGGAKPEDTEAVRANIENKAISQDRTISVKDYAYVIKQAYSDFVKDVNAWDLHDLPSYTTADLGIVYVSVLPSHYRTVPLLTQLEKDSIVQSLTKNYMIGGIELNMVDPVYIGINHSFDIYYSVIDLNTTITDLEAKIKTNVRSLYDADITKFKTYLPISRIQGTVDASDSSIVSSNLTVTCELYMNLAAGVDYTINHTLNNAITPGTISSTFLSIHDVDGGSGTGTITSSIGDIGTVNYSSGLISFTVPAVNITADSTRILNFTPVDKFMNVSFEQVMLDTDNYSYNFIEV